MTNKQIEEAVRYLATDLACVLASAIIELQRTTKAGKPLPGAPQYNRWISCDLAAWRCARSVRAGYSAAKRLGAGREFLRASRQVFSHHKHALPSAATKAVSESGSLAVTAGNAAASGQTDAAVQLQPA